MNKKNTSVLRDVKAALLAFSPAFLTAAASAYVPMEGGVVMPVLAFLIAAFFAGLVVLWRQAEAERRMLTVQLESLERQGQGSAAPQASRSPRPAAAGPAGLLRELARTADERQSTATPGAKPAAKPVLRLVPHRQPVRAEFPEPSLLPSLRRLSTDETTRIRLIVQAFEAERIELHLQPVVSLPQCKIRFYEVLTRLRLADGMLLSASEFLPILAASGRAPDFDRRVLGRSMAVARHLVASGSESILGVNLSPHSLAEPGFLGSVAAALDVAPGIAGRIVLELPQDSWRRLDGEGRAAVAELRERGVPFSLDRAADLAFDPQELADLGIRFMKLPAGLMIEAAAREDGRYAGPERNVRDFAPDLRRQGIRLIAEGVDQEEMVPVLCDLGVPLAQGFVFATPRPVKPEIFGEPSGLEDAPIRLRQAG
ncbi:cyclic-di-GMP phosphodiesterase TipF (flagellum assembly factor) [Microvirga flocculans]|uniref:Cyclic-di-GMP phosphodiesterase TipF (Flagellum assembly factor) n=1 Tax=Microvirga flocculans TaxID=217168 RepID=A0A7W6IEK7_9HYPH|nr:EAL domain-containing protein [Microvirga flocculans]MBB4040056.1 cyclic-di-GMP phosphodiesterase TipF (flagellum assembly factor) [Microvirga flocculans]